MHPLPVVVGTVLGTLAAAVAAPPPSTQPDPPPATQPDPETAGGLLRGPTVPDDAKPSLITLDAQGRLHLLPGRPEEAALGLALVDPDRREAARRLVTERRTALGMLLVDQIDLLRDATDASRAGESDAARAIYHELHAMFDPEPLRDPLLPAFAEVLEPDELAAIRALLDEYWALLLPRSMRKAGLDPDDPVRAAAYERRLIFETFQRELTEAFEWAIRPFQARLEALVEITDATPEQRSEIRDAIIDYVRESRLDPTPELRRIVAERIYEVLDESQRRRLFEHALWRL